MFEKLVMERENIDLFSDPCRSNSVFPTACEGEPGPFITTSWSLSSRCPPARRTWGTESVNKL